MSDAAPIVAAVAVAVESAPAVAADAALPDLRCLREWPESLPRSLQPELVRWLRDWNAIPHALDFRIESSSRMRSSLGRAYLDRRLVRINDRLARPGAEALLVEVLCHELAHLVVHERHGRHARPHGREWRSLLRQVGSRERVTIPREECAFLPPTRRRSRRRRAAWRSPGSDHSSVLGGIWSALRRLHGRLM
ncbi:MAG: SprT family zinc-dependent metalloprotease [Phycisphaerae bacterium]|nr:SprT family zinc-dependent metalloprotease [Phycisphaerae bacterium]